MSIVAYSDADWENNPEGRHSISGVMVMLGRPPGGLIMFTSRRQTVVAQSSTEAEYMAACEAVEEIELDQFLKQLGLSREGDNKAKLLYLTSERKHSIIW